MIKNMIKKKIITPVIKKVLPVIEKTIPLILERKVYSLFDYFHQDIMLHSLGKKIFVRINTIDYIKLGGSYSEFHFVNREKITECVTSKKLLAILPRYWCTQINRSILIFAKNMQCCDTSLMTAHSGEEFDITEEYRSEFKLSLSMVALVCN